MQDDLVARLRVNDAEIYLPILGQAADRIEALEAENERLRGSSIRNFRKVEG